MSKNMQENSRRYGAGALIHYKVRKTKEEDDEESNEQLPRHINKSRTPAVYREIMRQLSRSPLGWTGGQPISLGDWLGFDLISCTSLTFRLLLVNFSILSSFCFSSVCYDWHFFNWNVWIWVCTWYVLFYNHIRVCYRRFWKFEMSKEIEKLKKNKDNRSP